MPALITRSNLARISGLLALCGLLTASASAETWNQYRGGPERAARVEWPGQPPRTGPVLNSPAQSLETNIEAGAVKAWRAPIDTDAMFDASPVVAPDGTVYVGAAARTGIGPNAPGGLPRLLAFSRSGARLWGSALDGYTVRATPAVRKDGRLVVVGQRRPRDGKGEITKDEPRERVFLVDQRRGDVIARSDERGLAYRTSPLLAAGSDEPLVFWGGRFDRFLDPFTRTALGGMTFDVTGGFDWPDWPECIPPDLHCTFDTSAPAAWQPSDGDGPLAPSPAYSPPCASYAGAYADRVFLGRFGRTLRDSRRLWDKDIGAVQTPVLGKAGRLYLVTKDGTRLESYDQAGARLWRTRLGDDFHVRTPPALGRGPMPIDNRTGAPADVFECKVVDANGNEFTFRDGTSWIDTLYFGGEDRGGGGWLVKLGAKGRLSWAHRVGPESAAPPVVLSLPGGKELAVVGSGDVLSAWTARGDRAWRLTLDGPVRGTPAVSGGRIYVATTSSLYAIDGRGPQATRSRRR